MLPTAPVQSGLSPGRMQTRRVSPLADSVQQLLSEHECDAALSDLFAYSEIANAALIELARAMTILLWLS